MVLYLKYYKSIQTSVLNYTSASDDLDKIPGEVADLVGSEVGSDPPAGLGLADDL